MKNIAGMHEVLHDINAMDRVKAGNKACTAKEYLIELKVRIANYLLHLNKASGMFKT